MQKLLTLVATKLRLVSLLKIVWLLVGIALGLLVLAYVAILFYVQVYPFIRFSLFLSA